jgi:Xaa-Pro aminopeptidase
VTVTDVRPDDEALRVARRARLLAEMETNGIDVLVVGREGNARYVSGAPRLWMAGSRAFGPGCVLVRATGAVHLLSTWDEGIPEEIPHENLYGISFNAANFVTALKKIEGAATARTVATDSMSGSSAHLLPKAFPSAELVDGEPLLRRVRRVKTPEEVDAIRASVRIAERSLLDAEAALVPGITERQLTAVFMEAMALAGVTTPATQDVAWVTSREDPWRRANRDTPVERGDLVAFDAGVILGGYVGELGRTRPVGGDAGIDRGLFGRWAELWDRLLGACRVGSPLSGLLDAYDAAGLPPPPMPIARGLGLGFDLPLVTHDLPGEAANQHAEAGMVLALSAYVWKEGAGAVYGQEPVVLTETGPELLSTTPFRDARSWPT